MDDSNMTVFTSRATSRTGLAIIALLAIMSVCVKAYASTPIQLGSGKISGELQQGAIQYLGIPYAAPPVGPRRWLAPQDPEPWPDIKQALHFGQPCAQFGNIFASDDPTTFAKPFGSEDCLYLNVWQPPSPTSAPRKVLVFVHGGSGTMGATSLGLYNGSKLAEELDAIVVTINYRLGIFGSIHHPALHIDGDPATNSGSLALLDIVKSLEWVKTNIASFGGDPDKVTLAGQSAGGVSVWALLRSPLASGLFSKAVILSAIPLGAETSILKERSRRFIHNLMNLEDEKLSDEAFATRLHGMNNDEIYNYLHEKSTAEILAATQGDPSDDKDNIAYQFDAEDGYVLPVQDGNAKHDLINAVPLLMGSTGNETRFLLFFSIPGITEQALLELNKISLSDPNLRIGDLIPNEIPKYLLSSVLGNIYVDLKLSNASKDYIKTGQPLYRYEFLWRNFSAPWQNAFGAFHGLDLFFIFGNFPENTGQFGHFICEVSTQEERSLIHRQMTSALKGFMETGDPNTYPSGVNWPRWEGLIKTKAKIK